MSLLADGISQSIRGGASSLITAYSIGLWEAFLSASEAGDKG